jgi:hypothetical protein
VSRFLIRRNNPNFQFRRGVQGNDVPFSLRLSGIYELPYRIALSATFQRQKGFPEITTVSVGNNTVALVQGTTNITVEPRGTTRLPDLNERRFLDSRRVLQVRDPPRGRLPYRVATVVFTPKSCSVSLSVDSFDPDTKMSWS